MKEHEKTTGSVVLVVEGILHGILFANRDFMFNFLQGYKFRLPIGLERMAGLGGQVGSVLVDQDDGPCGRNTCKGCTH